MDHNHTVLKDFEYVSDIRFFNGSTGNAWDVINHRKIRTDAWNPYDGRSFGPLKGEYGIWVSTLNVWDYIVSNDLSELLVLEDDVVLGPDFATRTKSLIKELPKDWDFLSLHYFEGHNEKTSESDIGLDKIHKSINQHSGAQAIIYSNSGAKKLLKLVGRKGIEYTSDCFMFEQSRLGFVNGYSILPTINRMLKHEYKDIPSSIDPDNRRMVEM
jgi:GR25 family glycosyltransferase involved in LPS biosynthesis